MRCSFELNLENISQVSFNFIEGEGNVELICQDNLKIVFEDLLLKNESNSEGEASGKVKVQRFLKLLIFSILNEGF